MRYRLQMLALGVLAAVPMAAQAGKQPVDGTFDTSFNGDGKLAVAFDLGLDFADVGRAVRVQADGRVLVAGTVAKPGTRLAAGIVRLLPDGSLDPSFGISGRLIVDSECLEVEDAVLGPDDRLFLTVTLCTQLACTLRLDAAGRPDPAFGSNGLACLGQQSEGVTSLLDSDGSVLLVGSAMDGTHSVSVVRFDATGMYLASTGFGYGAGVDEVLGTAAILDRERRILLVSQILGAVSMGRDIQLNRFLPGGPADLSFGDNGDGSTLLAFDLGGTDDDRGLAVALAPDGDILVGGSAATQLGLDAAVVRLDPDGRNPAYFSFGFYSEGAHDDAIEGLAMQPDGRLLAAGTVEFDGMTGADFGVARLLVPGPGGALSLDPTFINGGRRLVGFDLGGGHADRGHDIALDSRGVLIAGEAEESGSDLEFAVTRLTLGELFTDGFESGDGSAWSATSP